MFKLPSYRGETVRGGTTLHYIALSYKDRAVISWTPSSYLTQFHRCCISMADYIYIYSRYSKPKVSQLYYRSGIRANWTIYIYIYISEYTWIRKRRGESLKNAQLTKTTSHHWNKAFGNVEDHERQTPILFRPRGWDLEFEFQALRTGGWPPLVRAYSRLKGFEWRCIMAWITCVGVTHASLGTAPSREAVWATRFREGPSEGLEYEETLSYHMELGDSSSICWLIRHIALKLKESEVPFRIEYRAGSVLERHSYVATEKAGSE